jgi:hypothetical protein
MSSTHTRRVHGAHRTGNVPGPTGPRSWALLLVLLAGVTACADTESDDPVAERTIAAEGDKPKPGDGLTFTRSGGSTYEIHDAKVACGSDQENEDVTVVRLSAPANPEHRGSRLLEPFLVVTAAPGAQGVYELPLDGGDLSAGETPPVAVFGVDSEDRNELSGSVEVATGTVRILEATCDPSPKLSVTMRATLGSEYGDMPTMHVVGGLSGSE